MTDKDLEIRNVLDGVFAEYDFGHAVMVVASDTWQTDEAPDYTKVVYVEWEEADIGHSEKVSFHVELNEDLTVKGAIAYLMSNGGEMGFLPEKVAKSSPKV